ncbi:Uncharacterized conserved protein, DUF2141 family [Zunongwangia mangrovi]|uniref:Uncharacterized conserved protein, DUF2141 family n=1 Tax=Zunongwangia mangrovi TaxID=1334022 RepID=A0A1I1GPP0_9FLAO|nr:DUF2141 domain-containing protein [Zunongwangia mangrovi]SFC13425.1 Uncharacterized conserved protein, DUF2141 family [Zunongwangia mangrovi]
MRTLAIIFALFISGLAAKAQETAKDSTGTISVEILNVTSDNGKIVYGIYTKDSFMKKPNFSKTAKIEDGKSVVTFTDIPAGEYAVICFHDKNDNDKMDFETNGMPQEDYGVSNNKLNPFGPPVWNDGKFNFDGDEEKISIRF